ncbi:hypothetical protein HDV57DRAFT_503078 [Trichoderma longibrachiatum]
MHSPQRYRVPASSAQGTARAASAADSWRGPAAAHTRQIGCKQVRQAATSRNRLRRPPEPHRLSTPQRPPSSRSLCRPPRVPATSLATAGGLAAKLYASALPWAWYLRYYLVYPAQLPVIQHQHQQRPAASTASSALSGSISITQHPIFCILCHCLPASRPSCRVMAACPRRSTPKHAVAQCPNQQPMRPLGTGPMPARGSRR